MKLLLFLSLIIAACNHKTSVIDGAYVLVAAKYGDSSLSKEALAKYRTVKILKNGYWISATTYSYSKIALEKAFGGTYIIKDGRCLETVRFSSDDNTIVNKTFTFAYSIDGVQYQRTGRMKSFNEEYALDETYEKIKPDKELLNSSLEGVWERTYGEWGGIKTEDPDFYEFKIFSYPTFAWAQYNFNTKEFIGSGGGTYTFDGKRLVEYLEYFSYGPLTPIRVEINITKFSKDSLEQETVDKVMRQTWKKIR